MNSQMHWTLISSSIFVLITASQAVSVLKMGRDAHHQPLRKLPGKKVDRIHGGTKKIDEERLVKSCSSSWYALTPSDYAKNPLIVVITPTRKRLTRIADMTRLSQTLTLVQDLVWIVVEESNYTLADPMQRILDRSLLPNCYIAIGLPESSKGKKWRRARSKKQGIRGPTREAEWRWRSREVGLRVAVKRFSSFGANAVVYFADQEGSYDRRLFDNYIRKVRTVGVWAVGLPETGQLVIAPEVSQKGIVEGWLSHSTSHNTWQMDAPGFAINMKVLAEHPGVRVSDCGKEFPAQCLMRRLGVRLQDVQPFGHNTNPRRVFVWRTVSFNDFQYAHSFNYVVECEPFVYCTR